MKITCTFYEDPAALADIEMWEKLKGGDIHFKEIVNKDIIFYLQDEILICSPIQTPNITLFKENINTKGNYYHKTLIFGKVTSETLPEIVNFTNEQEKIKPFCKKIV